MSDDDLDLVVPTHARAGTAFLGTELKDAYLFLCSLFLALPAGKIFGLAGYFGIPFCGFHLNRFYLDWLKNSLPGQFTSYIWKTGIGEVFSFMTYSKAFSNKNKVIVGDAKVANPDDWVGEVIEEASSNLIKARNQNGTHGT